jgi:hypothetical protein
MATLARYPTAFLQRLDIAFGESQTQCPPLANFVVISHGPQHN